MNKRVAIIGAGPSGIVSAKFLQQEGLQVVLFDQSDQAGGQWHTENTLSGIWPGMPTNTSRVMTQFSDLDHLPDIPVFPSAEEIQAYLQRYLDAFDLRPALRLNSHVEQIQPRTEGGWLVEYQSGDGARNKEHFDFVLIASGRFNQPYFPDVPGVDSLEKHQARIAISHSHQYRGPKPFEGSRVLVAGGAISALEIASDLALAGAVDVSCAYRNQRYVLGKLAQGIPTDHINFSLYEALAAERLSSEVLAAQMRDFVVSEFGSPEIFGAPRPDDDLRIAGTTKCEHFLDLVANQRINLRPWLQGIDGQTVVFSDGTRQAFDHIVFATGYQLRLPFLRPAEAQIMKLDSKHIGLYQHTFHPDLPGLALTGYYNQVGPYFPVLELQARWIAKVWSQQLPAPSDQTMRDGLHEYLNSWKQQQKLPMHKLALLFARAIDAVPEPNDWPGIERALWFGPLCATVFRLSGPDALANAPDKAAAAARAFGMITEPMFTPNERQRLQIMQCMVGPG